MKKSAEIVVRYGMLSYICNRKTEHVSWAWRGARAVMEQIANLSTGNRRQGSSPCLSA